MQHFHQRFLKEDNGDQKYFMFPDLQDNNFEVLHSEIILDKVDLDCVETVKANPKRNDSGFIAYSNTIHFSVLLLDNSQWLANNSTGGI